MGRWVLENVIKHDMARRGNVWLDQKSETLADLFTLRMPRNNSGRYGNIYEAFRGQSVDQISTTPKPSSKNMGRSSRLGRSRRRRNYNIFNERCMGWRELSRSYRRRVVLEDRSIFRVQLEKRSQCLNIDMAKERGCPDQLIERCR